jgi:excinuclease UvrABC nuclease subunit
MTHPRSSARVSRERAPLWYTQVQFTAPRPAALVKLTLTRDVPDLPGCYVFTADDGKLVPGEVLYVGQALSLVTRLRGYLVDFLKVAPTRHKGRAFLFDHRHRHGEAKLFLRWTVYGDPTLLEASLIDHLEPAFNSRLEEDPFADDEPLDRRYLP